MSFVTFFLRVVISRKTVKLAKNTIFDTCAENSRRYEFCDIFAHTVLISRKTVKSTRNVGNCRVLVELCYLFTNRSVMGIV